MRVDHAADTVYLKLTDRPIKDSEDVADGIEILGASKRTADPTALKEFRFEEA